MLDEAAVRLFGLTAITMAAFPARSSEPASLTECPAAAQAGRARIAGRKHGDALRLAEQPGQDAEAGIGSGQRHNGGHRRDLVGPPRGLDQPVQRACIRQAMEVWGASAGTG